MHYAKVKRDKISICNICREEKSLSWDHVPPQGGIELSKVEMETVFGLMTGNRENQKLRESQNGVKFRTICKECNELLGLNYDPTLNDFALSIGKYLSTRIKLPNVVTHKVKPQRLFKSLLGHLVAAKVDIENTSFDVMARDYILDKGASLPEDINVFYWVYPYTCSIVIRDFVMFTPRGTFNEPAVFQTLKYYPIAFLLCDKSEYAGLDTLSQYRECNLDDEVEIPINLRRIEHPYWPEAPSDEDNNIFFGGQSAMNAIHARRKS